MFRWVGGGGVYSFIWPLGVCAAHQGMKLSGLLSWKGVFLEEKSSWKPWSGCEHCQSMIYMSGTSGTFKTLYSMVSFI